jgi:DNA repair exonuclease SbcCD ATPase subunit
VQVFNQILGDKERYIAQFEEMLPLLADISASEVELAEAQENFDTIVGRMHRYMEENTRQIQNQDKYERRWSEMGDECKAAEKRVAEIKDEIVERKARKEKIRRFLDELRRSGDIVTKFDESLWQATVESVTVNSDKSLLFVFKDGTKIAAEAPESKQRG